MRQPKNISGIYIRYQNPETMKWENWCIEDLPTAYREEMLQSKEKEWLIGLANILCDTVNNLTEQFSITTKPSAK